MGSGQPWQPRSYPVTSESIWNRLGTTKSRNLIAMRSLSKWTEQFSSWYCDFYILLLDPANERVITVAVRQLTETVSSDKWAGVLLIITCGALTARQLYRRGGGVTANLVLNQLQQIFCLQATNYHGITHTGVTSFNSQDEWHSVSLMIKLFHWLLRGTILRERFDICISAPPLVHSSHTIYSDDNKTPV